MKFTISTVLLFAALLLGGCRDWFPPVDPNDPKNPSDPKDSTHLNDTNYIFLTRHRWCLVSIESQGLVQMPIDQIPRYVIFDGTVGPSSTATGTAAVAGIVHGEGGYNSFTGEFQGTTGSPAEGGLLTVTNLMPATKNASDNLEAQFFAILADAQQYVGNDLGMKIISSTGMILHFEPCDDDVQIDDPLTVDFNEDFRLRSNMFARVVDGSKEVFITVSPVGYDDRCPIGMQCAWEGDAALSVTIMVGNSSVSGDLHTNGAVGSQSVTLGNYEVRLVDLTPYPVVNQVIPATDYVALLRVTKR